MKTRGMRSTIDLGWVVGAALLVPCATAAASEAPATAAAAPAAKVDTFDVLEYRVLGNSVLKPDEIERTLYPLLGRNKTLDDVQAARKALEDLYHERGYGTAFVDIPPQTVRDGLVRLHVTEGTVERRVINGARYFPEREVIAQLPAATPGQVLQLSKLQEQLGVLNSQTADRSVVPVLKAGSEPGTVDLALTVNDTLPLHGSFEINNQATVDTRELRGIASLNYDNLFGRLDSLAFQYQFTPQDFSQVRVFAVNYAAHPFESGLQPSLSYINSNSNVPTAGTLGVLGIGEIISAKLAYPVSTSPGSVQSVSVGVDYKHFRNTINQNATTALDTPISYLNLSVGYAASWRADFGTTTFSVNVNTGPSHVVNNPESFENDRFQSRANYVDVRVDLATTIKLPREFGLKLRVAGQGAIDPLIANEDYSLTGADGVRGYLEAEELVDAGVKETVQLISPPLRRGGHTLGDAFTFFDAGKGRVYDALPGQPGEIRVRSWGMGLDVMPLEKITGSVSWARALDSASVTRTGGSRILFFLRGSL
jgi:hemolysin activation/secretion protein